MFLKKLANLGFQKSPKKNVWLSFIILLYNFGIYFYFPYLFKDFDFLFL
jgi:hypothetical protein